MAELVQLHARPAAEPDRIAVLEAQLAELAARLAGVEARLPRKRFTIPHGFVGLKDAVALSGVSKSTLYRKIKRGEVVAVKTGVITAIDLSTLARRGNLNL